MAPPRGTPRKGKHGHPDQGSYSVRIREKLWITQQGIVEDAAGGVPAHLTIAILSTVPDPVNPGDVTFTLKAPTGFAFTGWITWAYHDVNTMAAGSNSSRTGTHTTNIPGHEVSAPHPRGCSPALVIATLSAGRPASLDANAVLREGRKGLRKITGPATQHRINDTLSSALSDAVDKELIAKNWATLVELPPAKRPKPLVWTDERVEEWRRTGERPSPVMVWTPEQTGKFLDEMLADRLYPLWHSFVFFGFR